MSSKKQLNIKRDKLTGKTVQIIGFIFTGVLILIRVIFSIQGRDSGISELLIGGFAGMGASATYVLNRDKNGKK